MLSKLLGFILIFPMQLFAADIYVGLPSGGDDWANLQNILVRGDRIVLNAGSTYKISRRLDINHSDSGIIVYGDAATIRMLHSFNYANPDITSSGPRENHTNGIGIYIGQDLTTPKNGISTISNIRLENFHLAKDHVDGTYVNGIWARGVSDVTISKVEMSGFSIGYIIAIDSVNKINIHNCVIRDSWANVAPTDSNGKYFIKMPQLTGIAIDDNKVIGAVTRKSVLSTDISIVNNKIYRLRLGDALFNQARTDFRDPTGSAGNLGYETDAITIVGGKNSPIKGGSANITIAMNEIYEVGEGIDNFSENVLIEGNSIRDTFIFGIKLVHGARDNVIKNNVVERSGIASVVIAGSEVAKRHSSGNLIEGNLFVDVGDRSFACGSNVQAPFKLTENCSLGHVSGILLSMNQGSDATGYPKDNIIFGNIFRQAASLPVSTGVLLSSSANGGPAGTVILSNDFSVGFREKLLVDNNAPGTISDIPVSDALGKYQLESQGSKLIHDDLTGDNIADTFISWDISGKNYLYVNSSNKLRDVISLIINAVPTGGINGYPDRLVSGDFDGNGQADLLFSWDGSGVNRAYYNYSNGFTAVNSPIASSAINGYPSNVIVGDFDGNLKDDVCFIWKNSGLNRCAWSAGMGIFTVGAETISPTAINGYPDDILTGDFNGDGQSDMYFIWRSTGTNRLFYGEPNRSFTFKANPIGSTAINGNANYLLVDDYNQDGIDDINYFWTSIGIARLFSGNTNNSFTPEF